MLDSSLIGFTHRRSTQLVGHTFFPHIINGFFVVLVACLCMVIHSITPTPRHTRQAKHQPTTQRKHGTPAPAAAAAAVAKQTLPAANSNINATWWQQEKLLLLSNHNQLPTGLSLAMSSAS